MEDLQKLHALHLVLANELKRICNKYNIKYFMVKGTLLGAIRHKGFIPWDDDMDFGMKRKNYEKFLQVCKKELDQEKFYLQTEATDELYTFEFAKLRLEGTEIIEEFSKDVNTHHGIFIDIFPFDNVADNVILRFFQIKKFWFYRSLSWVKCGYGSKLRKKEFKYKVTKIVSKLFSIEFIKKQKKIGLTKYNNKNTKYIICGDGHFGIKKEIINSEWIEAVTEYQFEDEIFLGIKDYDNYLKHFYGDYMTLTPEGKRNRHHRISINYGIYK